MVRNMAPRTDLIEVSITDFAPGLEGDEGAMRFIGYTDEEKARIVLIEIPRTEGAQMLKDLESGEEPVAYCEEEDFLFQVPQRFPNLPMSPLAELASRVVIGPDEPVTPKSATRVRLEELALMEIEKAALASNELDEARKHNEDVFNAASTFRTREAEMRKAIENLILHIAETSR